MVVNSLDYNCLKHNLANSLHTHTLLSFSLLTMATQIDITRLIKTGLKDKNDKPKPDRYNIYLLLQNRDRWGVVTRSGIFQEDGSPKLSLISGKFHDTEDAARAAYDALVKKQRDADAKDGSYNFEPDADTQWSNLTDSVEKRQRALEARRAKKADREAAAEEQHPKPDVPQVKELQQKEEIPQEEELQQKEEIVQEDKKPKKKAKKSKKKADKVEEVQDIQKIEEVVEEVQEVKEVVKSDDEAVKSAEEESSEDDKPKKKKRTVKVPAHFQPDEEGREEAWQALKPQERKAWKKANPLVEE